MNKMGLVFNIQRYSLNDGDGIRTMVFLKGCSLRCPWCSNPESQSEKIEIMINKEKAEKYKNISGADEISSEIVGKWYSVNELINEVLKDEVFFNTSGGGVTLSGGEILNQSDFSIEFLKELKENGINTAIETCGYGDNEKFSEILEYTDTVLFDLKILDNDKSKKILLGESDIILNNLKTASGRNNVVVRFPYIPGYTDDMGNIQMIIKVMKDNNIKNIDILPYHNYGSKKYENLNRKYLLEDLEIPNDKEINRVKKIFEKSGFIVNIGG